MYLVNKIARRPKERVILDAALKLLREEGDSALTMRALANRADMSLSNVQYYFKDKDVLLKALVEDYFEICAAQITQMAQSSDAGNQDDRLRDFLKHVFSEGQELSDMCAVFRELWAIATRNDRVAEELQRYYRQLADILCREVFPDVHNEQTLQDFKLLIIPYVEGYSIAGRSIDKNLEEAVSLIGRLVNQMRETA